MFRKTAPRLRSSPTSLVFTQTGIKGSINLRRTRARHSSRPRQLFEPFLRLLVIWKTALIKPERARVVVTPSFDQTRRVFDVEHLMIEDVLHKPFRNIDGIQSFADRDALVNMVMVTEDAFGPAL